MAGQTVETQRIPLAREILRLQTAEAIKEALVGTYRDPRFKVVGAADEKGMLPLAFEGVVGNPNYSVV